MKRDIIVGKDFRTYVKSPLIADDTMAYNIIWDLGVPCENSEFLITAFREDGQIVTDTGTIDEKGKASYTLANNMYCIEGQAEIRLSILTNTTTLTDKILIFDVLSPNNINAIEGNTDEQLINTLMAKFNEATNKLNNIPSKTSDLENDSDFTTKAYVDEVVPTKTSQLTNDSDFTTKAYVDEVVPTKTSQLTNDSDFAYKTDIPTKTTQLENDANYWCIYDYQPLANALNDIGVAYKSNIPEVPTKVSQLENDSGLMRGTPEYAFFLAVLFGRGGGEAQNYVLQDEIPTKVSQLENDSGFMYGSPEYASFLTMLFGRGGGEAQNYVLQSELGKYVVDENYVHTDNNFDNYIAQFCYELNGYLAANPSNVASKSYVDEKLGVIENGSY